MSISGVRLGWPLLVAACAGLFNVPALAGAAKNFPGFAARKASLGTITLLVDGYVLYNVQGDVELAKLDLGRDAESQVLAVLKQGLESRGYKVGTAACVSAGQTVRLDWAFRAASDSTAAPPGDSAGVFRAPFWIDTTLLADAPEREAWDGLLGRMLLYKKRPNDAPGFFVEPTVLRDVAGGDVIAAVTAQFYGVTQKERLDRTAGLGPLRGVMKSVYAEETLAPNLCQASVLFLLADAKSGEVLWFDRRTIGGTYSVERMRKLASEIAEELP